MIPISIVIRCGYDYERLKRCLASIDESVDVVVSTAEDSKIAQKGIKGVATIVTHQYGNWSLAVEVGVQRARYDKIILMDADSTFEKNAIALLYRALCQKHLVVKPKVVFLHDGSPIAKLISNIRTHQNEYKPKAFTPGLALDKKKLISILGVNGHLYDVGIKYADDGNLNNRIYNKKVSIKLLSSAKVYHEPVTLKHEIKTAYILGKGNRQADGRLGLIELFGKETSVKARQFYIDANARFGISTMVALIIWRVVYYLGYFSASK